MEHWQTWFRIVGYSLMLLWLQLRRRRRVRAAKARTRRLEELFRRGAKASGALELKPAPYTD